MIRIGIATHKAREAVFKECLPTLLNQTIGADEICIYLNDYERIPAWLKKLPVKCTLGKDAAGDLNTTAKFYFTKDYKGVYITADDDFFYDRRYIGYLNDMVYRFNGKAIVGLHGKNHNTRPVKSYHHDAEYFYCMNELNRNTWVDYLGTGLMAFHTKRIEIHSSDFSHKNMADPELCRMIKKNQWPTLCLSKQANFVVENRKGFDTAIWQQAAKDDTVQTEIINSITNWTRATAINESTGLTPKEWQEKYQKIKKQLTQ